LDQHCHCEEPQSGDEAIQKSEFSALDCFPLAALAVAMTIQFDREGF
jgi:hypothetical protein